MSLTRLDYALITMNERILNPQHLTSMNRLRSLFLLIPLVFLIAAGCARQTELQTPPTEPPILTPLDNYVATPDEAYAFETVQTLPGDGQTTYVLRMTSQRWLTTAEVKDPVWWHWLTVVVPDDVQHDVGLLVIGGGRRQDEAPRAAPEFVVQTARLTGSVTAHLHNVPNQPMTFVGDDFGPREEDELIAYGWRQFIEGGGQDKDIPWLARMPMTTAAVRALDTITSFCATSCGHAVERFVVAGASKRGWTTWTTAAVDDRVVAIAPIVIDMLNVIPSFQHHWRVYGFWAPAVGDYQREGIMDAQDAPEYKRLLDLVEPYSFRDRLDLPKYLINATGDEFFIPDSWQFYWDDLIGEKHLRYVPNANHSLAGTDAIENFVAFYHSVVTETPRPSFDWRVADGVIHLTTDPAQPPIALTLWQATNPDARDFRLTTIGRTWTNIPITLATDGHYTMSVDAPKTGHTAFFAELHYPGAGDLPLVFTTGVVVTPDTYAHPPFASED